MGGFQKTTFEFTNGGALPLTLQAVLVYNSNNQWQEIAPAGSPFPGNSGIESPVISNASMPNGGDSCTVTLDMDAGNINSSPYSSDGSSLIFNVNGSNIHIDIHNNGNMESKGILGASPNNVKWSTNFGGIGELNTLFCIGQ